MNWTVVENETKSSALIRVVGVGGAGGNAVNHMVESGIEGVQMICANTDEQALDTNLAELKITLGTGISNGLGAGGKPEVGRDAALEKEIISKYENDIDLAEGEEETTTEE